MSGTPSVAGRAALAAALLVGFYALALGVAAGLLWIPYAEWSTAHRVHVRLAFFCLVSAGVILWALVPRRDRFTAPGPALDAAAQPELFQMLQGIAAKTGQEMPRDVYLVGDVNAWVAERGGVMGVGSRRVMGLGLPLLQLLSVAQLRAVLAHEFGHFYGGDTRLGPWIYKTRAAIGRTLAGLARHSPLLMKPFEWYGRLFLRVTHAVSRQQELTADALACRVVGTAPLVEGLRAVHAAAPAFAAYWRSDVVPVLQAGFAPPIGAGFRRFVGAERVADAMRKHVEGEIRQGAADPYDTHPPLRERIEAAQLLPRSPARAAGDGDEAAVSLLRDVADLERNLLATVAGREAAEKMRTLSWEDVAEALHAPAWQRAVASNRAAFADMTPLGVYDAASAGIDAFARRLAGLPSAVEERRAAACWHLAAGVAHVLHRAGWKAAFLPGEGIELRRGGDACRPFELVGRIASGGLAQAEWARLCERLDIAALPIAGGGAAAG